jgi:hypothetical protein
MIKKMVLMMVSLVLLSSCGLISGGGGGGSTSSSQGLTINFLPGLPPPTVYDSEQLSIQMQVFNRGAYQVGGPGDRVYLSGHDQNIITGIDTGGEPISKIAGVDQFNVQGASDFVTFDNIVIRRIDIERFPVQMLATACYGYETVASATVCLDPNPNVATLKQKVCSPAAVQVLSQAAPVTVTNIKAEPRKGVTTFRISINNVGGGTVFRNGASQSDSYLNRCSPHASRGLGFDEVDYAQVLGVTVGGLPVNCKATTDDGHVRLSSGAGTFVCEVSVQGNDAYSSPMTVHLGYGYRQQQTTNFQIIRTP